LFSDKNKIFIGGVPRDAKEEDFKALFAPFGDLTDCVIIKDKFTGESRGFGFVSYTDDAAVDKVLAQPIELNGKKLDCKSATPRPSDRDRGGRDRRGRRGDERDRRGPSGRDRDRDGRGPPRRRPRYDPYDDYYYEDDYDRPRGGGGYRTYDVEDGYGGGGRRGPSSYREDRGGGYGGGPYSAPPPPPPPKSGAYDYRASAAPPSATPVSGGAYGAYSSTAAYGAYGGFGNPAPATGSYTSSWQSPPPASGYYGR